MADLTTLDPTAPPDSELVSNGANRMREERGDLIGFAGLEHQLTGAHKFPNGDGTFPALPGVPAPGNAGRIFYDTIGGRLLFDTGTSWNLLHTVGRLSLHNQTLTTITQTLPGTVYLSGNLNYPQGAKVMAIAQMNMSTGTSGAAITATFMRDATPFDFPNSIFLVLQFQAFVTFMAMGIDQSGTAGNHTVGLRLSASNPGMQFNEITMLVTFL